jgi:hypothetical protein
LRKQRGALARFSSEIFLSAGTELYILGDVVGADRITAVQTLADACPAADRARYFR